MRQTANRNITTSSVVLVVMRENCKLIIMINHCLSLPTACEATQHVLQEEHDLGLGSYTTILTTIENSEKGAN